MAETTAARLTGETGDAVRKRRAFDSDHYVADRAPLALGELQSLPVPGKLELGSGGPDSELELHPADGHTPDGMAIWVPWARVGADRFGAIASAAGLMPCGLEPAGDRWFARAARR